MSILPLRLHGAELGYLQTAYGTYDAMTVEAIRALNEKIAALELENDAQKKENEDLKSQLDRITAALAGAGIAVEK